MKPNKPKFTPDYWEVEVDGNGCHVSFRDFPYNTVESDPDNELQELDSYAALIAAAPKMYEALEKLCNEPECPNHISDYLLPVLAKARGES